MRVFIAQKYELGERWDPMMVAYRRNLSHFKYQPVSLASLLIAPPQYGANESGIKRISEKQVRYIRITDINDNGLLNNNLGATVERINAKYILNHNDLLFARSGATVGKTFLYKKNLYNYPCLFAGYLIKFQLNPSIVIPDYLFIYTQLSSYKDWIIATQRAAAQPNINAEEYKSLQVPLPPLTVQNKIYEIYHFAVLNKQKKEQEANALLASIDDHLLSELGIERPTLARTENGRFFYTSYKEVIGKRLDPLAYSEQAQKIKHAIINGKYPCSSLKSLTIQEAAGDWGIDITDDYNMQIYSKCLVLRSTEFNAHHNLVIDDAKAKYRLINKKKLQNIDLQINDLIIEKSGGSENQPVGRIAIITKNLWENDTLCYSNFVQKIRINKNKVIPKYMYYFLRLVHNLKLTETMQSQTNGIRNLILSEYYAQQIPIPSIEKQRDIISQIEVIYNKAIELQKSAKEIINNAKQKIEQMILGK